MDRHPLEFGVTLRYMEKYYPKGGKVLDVGGGPGRYAILLAKKGFDVTLFDISLKNVEFAEKKAEEEDVRIQTICADALELDKNVEGKFDVVQCMGPLYHLLREEDRISCVRQCLALLKPGGVFLASFISSYAVLADVIAKYPQTVAQFKKYFLNLGEDMTNVESGENPGFTDAYFTYPLNIGPFFAKFGLSEIAIAGVEGPAGLSEPAIRQLPDKTVDEWVDIAYNLSQDKLTWGTNQHFLYIGRKDG
jgi:SAM-dependent methyltransferase